MALTEPSCDKYLRYFRVEVPEIASFRLICQKLWE